jgi:hypothetical protein
MTATALQTVPDTARFTAASALQKLLPELVALTLNAKQAHWNVTGPAFLPLHTLTDEIAADLRTWVDRVAEHTVALGFAVDARPERSPPSAASCPPDGSPITKRSPSSSSTSTRSSPQHGAQSPTSSGSTLSPMT